jgi:hypothetical protein
MATIVAQQFLDLKKGDRYYYENPSSVNPGAFTADQLNQIRTQTLARMICNNFDLVTSIQPRVLRVVDNGLVFRYIIYINSIFRFPTLFDFSGNPISSCASGQFNRIGRTIDLTKWKE